MLAVAVMACTGCAARGAVGQPVAREGAVQVLRSVPEVLSKSTSIVFAPLSAAVALEQQLQPAIIEHLDSVMRAQAAALRISVVPAEAALKNFAQAVGIPMERSILRNWYERRGWQPAKNTLLDLARRTGADLTAIFTITSFSRRVGGRLGAEEQAKIGLHLDVISISTEASVWQGRYFYEDQPLSNNILHPSGRKRGESSRGWFDEKELFRRAAQELLASFGTDLSTPFEAQ